MVLWKPAGSAILSNYVFYRILREAGVPPGVINFVPSEGSVFGRVITRSPHFAGLNFTGSTRHAIALRIGYIHTLYILYMYIYNNAGNRLIT